MLLKSGRQDSNLRPPGPKPGALPGCATPRCNKIDFLFLICGCKGIILFLSLQILSHLFSFFFNITVLSYENIDGSAPIESLYKYDYKSFTNMKSIFMDSVEKRGRIYKQCLLSIHQSNKTFQMFRKDYQIQLLLFQISITFVSDICQLQIRYLRK